MSTRGGDGSGSLACPQTSCEPKVVSRRGVSAFLDPHWLGSLVQLGLWGMVLRSDDSKEQIGQRMLWDSRPVWFYVLCIVSLLLSLIFYLFPLSASDNVQFRGFCR